MSNLHFQGIFEGLKAYRTIEGEILLFRPEENAIRMITGAERLCMPTPPVDLFVQAVKKTVLANERWVRISAAHRLIYCSKHCVCLLTFQSYLLCKKHCMCLYSNKWLEWLNEKPKTTLGDGRWHVLIVMNSRINRYGVKWQNWLPISICACSGRSYYSRLDAENRKCCYYGE
jgi:hypothetical protein